MKKNMRATLHHHAPNTYYGQWPRLFPREIGPKIAGHCPSWNRWDRPTSVPLVS
jgi:hypothetical protein